MMQRLQIENLHFTYSSRSEPTLRGIDVTVESGEFVLLTGPTGCGKSTLLRTLNGLIPHASGGKLSGCVRIDGMNVAEQPLAVTCQQVGLLFQNPDDQLFCIVVEDEIAFGLENLGLSPSEIDRRIDVALEQVGLPEFRHRLIASLSGGEKQRVALACVCAMQPRILLLDEPTSHLDPQATLDILGIIRHLNQALGMTVIIAAHQVNEIAPLCNRVWLMNNGELNSDLPIDQAFHDLEPYRQLGVQVPELAQLMEQLGYPERPLTLEHAVQLFANGRIDESTRTQIDRITRMKDEVESTPEANPRNPKNPCFRISESANQRINENEKTGKRDPFHASRFTFHVSRITHHASTDNLPLISVQGLTFRYPRPSVDVLKELSFQIQRGEVVAIMGANGSGKTTLLMHLVALLRPSAGSVTIEGQDARRCKPHHLAGKVGIIFQNPDLLLQAATVSDEVVFGPKNLKLSRQEVQNRLENILLTFDLEGLKAEAPYALSRGQRQRTAVAAIFSLYPDLLLLDEPTTGQDHHHLQQLMGVLCYVMKRQNKTVIFCTHDVHLTLKYADRVLLLHRGTLVFDGTPDAAFVQPELLKRVSLVPPLTMQLAWELGMREENQLDVGL